MPQWSAALARSSRGGIEVDVVPLGNGLPVSRPTPLNEPAVFEEEPVWDVVGACVKNHLANLYSTSVAGPRCSDRHALAVGTPSRPVGPLVGVETEDLVLGHADRHLIEA